MLDVVKADEREVAGDLEAPLSRGLDDADNCDVVDGEERRRRIRKRKQFERRFAGDVCVYGARLGHELGVELDRSAVESVSVALEPVTSRRDVTRLRDHADPPMAETDEMVD